MDIRIIKEPISRDVALEIAKEFYVNMVKGVVDIEREIVALGGEWHIDSDMELLRDGSKQENLWGFNFFPEENRIAFTSLINIRPLQNNRAIEIQDPKLKDRMERIIRKLIV